MTDPSVLFVTGQHRSRDATASALESTGLRVISADGPLDAVKHLDSEEIDSLALAPPLGEPGAEWLVRRVRRSQESIPVLLIGGRRDAASNALAAAATDYVEHDDVTRIAERVRELVADHRAHRAIERHRALKDRLFDLASALPEATDRAAIEREVHDLLVTVDNVHDVRVGAYDPETDAIRMRFPPPNESGTEAIADGSSIENAEFVERAVSTGTIQTKGGDVRSGTGIAASTGESEEEAEYTAIAVPLGYAGSIQGVVVLGTRRPGVIDSSTRSLLADMGTIVGRELDRLDDRDSSAATEDAVRQFAEGLAHELRNTVGIAATHLELGRDGDEESLDRAREALDDMERTVDGMLSLATGVEETTERGLRDDVVDAWETIETTGAELVIEGSSQFEADHDQAVRLLANLLRNAVEHGAADRREPTGDASGSTDDSEPPVTVRVGMIDSGFYVEDDGPGIPGDARDRIFEWGYSDGEGIGLGLAIVEAIAEAHDWSVSVTDGRDSGARFEVTGVRRSSD